MPPKRKNDAIINVEDGEKVFLYLFLTKNVSTCSKMVNIYLYRDLSL